MDLKPLILSLALIPAFAQAGEFDPEGYEPARGSSAWNEAHGVNPTAPVEYGTRTDIYLMEDGDVQIQEHMANDEDDEVRVYDYDLDDGDAYDE